MLLVCLFPSRHVRAEEGLWTPDHFPAGLVLRQYGVTIKQGWLNHVEQSSVRLSNGCSASFVSASGLVLTNNHCVADCSSAASSEKVNIFEDGFIALANVDEKRCRGLQAENLLSVTDVTLRLAAPTRQVRGDALIRARRAAAATLEKNACHDDLELRCSVVPFFTGAQYKLFRYRVFADVRLVFSPGTKMSHFDGETSSPHNFDVAFLRVYRHDSPVPTPVHLQWNRSAPKVGQLVFLAGSPRLSERELTATQLATERDFLLPEEIRQRHELNALLEHFQQEGSAEDKWVSEAALTDSQNHTAYIETLESALKTSGFVEAKRKGEAHLEAPGGSFIAASLSTIQTTEREKQLAALRHQLVASGPFFDAASAELFFNARQLVRIALERAKPEQERRPGFSDAEIRTREVQLLQEQHINASYEQLILQFWLNLVSSRLPDNDPLRQALLQGSTPKELAERLAHSQLGELEQRRRLLDGGRAAIFASTDPMIRYVLALEPPTEALEAEWRDRVLTPQTQAALILAAARLHLLKQATYPDANGTLRISYGSIRPTQAGATQVGAFSTFNELFQSEHHERIDPRWLAARSRLAEAGVFNMLTTNDGINGNSGSPILNSRGDVVGVFYGGNAAALAGDYGYDPKSNRALVVPATAIQQVLQAVYGANALVEELRGTSK